MKKSDLFPDNRFIALDEFLNLLGFRRFEWQSLFKVLSKAGCGFLEFCIGDLVIEINVGSGDSFGIEEGDWIQIIFHKFKNNIEKSATYTFNMSELKALDRERKLKRKDIMKL
jgi:hypothetical protein